MLHEFIFRFILFLQLVSYKGTIELVHDVAATSEIVSVLLLGGAGVFRVLNLTNLASCLIFLNSKLFIFQLSTIIVNQQ